MSYYATRRMLAALAVLMILAATTHVMAQATLPAGTSNIRVISPLRPEMDVEAGETHTHRLMLENTGAEPVLVEISQVDLFFEPNGERAYAPVTSLPQSNASWIEVPSQIEVPPAASYALPITVHVPDDAQHGSYWSVLFVQPIDATSLERQESQEGDVRTMITVNYRFGVTLTTHVGQPAEQDVHFHDPAVVRDDENDTTSVSLTLENPGRFLVAGDLWLELYDQQGNLIHESERKDLRVYPDASRRHTFDLGVLEDDAYQAVIIADAGDDAVFGVRYELDLSSD